MSLVKLKKLLGIAGAGIDESLGQDTLLDVLTAMAGLGSPLTFGQLTVAVELLAGMVMPIDGVVTELVVELGTTGSSSTILQVFTSPGGGKLLSFLASDPNGIQKTLVLNQEVKKGDIVKVEVSTAGSGAANMFGTLSIAPVEVEA